MKLLRIAAIVTLSESSVVLYVKRSIAEKEPMTYSSTLPSPATGRPLLTVNQVHYARKSGAVLFSELADGTIVQIYQARHQKGVFQVNLGDTLWAASPRRIWAAKTAVYVPSSGKVCVTRTPVGERSLDDLQAMAFQTPMWLEATMDTRWVIMPQLGRRRLAFKNWSQERSVYTAPKFTELVALMREQEWTNQLLDQDEHAPLRSWQIATPVVQHAKGEDLSCPTRKRTRQQSF